MLAASPTAQSLGQPAEEWAIHDYEGFGHYRVGEYQPIEAVSTVARGIQTHGLAFAAYAAEFGSEQADFEGFEGAYLGEWESVEQYAEDLIDSTGVDAELDRVVGEWLRPYVKFDIEQLAYHISMDFTIIAAPNGHVWLFSH